MTASTKTEMLSARDGGKQAFKATLDGALLGSAVLTATCLLSGAQGLFWPAWLVLFAAVGVLRSTWCACGSGFGQLDGQRRHAR